MIKLIYIFSVKLYSHVRNSNQHKFINEGGGVHVGHIQCIHYTFEGKAIR